MKRFARQLLKRLVAWALVKLASAGIDEADGTQVGRQIKAKAPAPIVTALDGWLKELREGLA